MKRPSPCCSHFSNGSAAHLSDLDSILEVVQLIARECVPVNGDSMLGATATVACPVLPSRTVFGVGPSDICLGNLSRWTMDEGEEGKGQKTGSNGRNEGRDKIGGCSVAP